MKTKNQIALIISIFILVLLLSSCKEKPDIVTPETKTSVTNNDFKRKIIYLSKEETELFFKNLKDKNNSKNEKTILAGIDSIYAYHIGKFETPANYRLTGMRGDLFGISWNELKNKYGFTSFFFRPNDIEYDSVSLMWTSAWNRYCMLPQWDLTQNSNIQADSIEITNSSEIYYFYIDEPITNIEWGDYTPGGNIGSINLQNKMHAQLDGLRRLAAVCHSKGVYLLLTQADNPTDLIETNWNSHSDYKITTNIQNHLYLDTLIQNYDSIYNYPANTGVEIWPEGYHHDVPLQNFITYYGATRFFFRAFQELYTWQSVKAVSSTEIGIYYGARYSSDTLYNFCTRLWRHGVQSGKADYVDVCVRSSGFGNLNMTDFDFKNAHNGTSPRGSNDYRYTYVFSDLSTISPTGFTFYPN